MPESPVEFYEQEVEIECDSAASAEAARVSLAPLYDGYAWSISSRWDDNNREGDLALHEVLVRHGYKATWYLNAVQDANFLETARALLQGGNSVGGHSLTHPMMTYLCRNRMFEELAGVRMEWEAALDRPVISYTFSFCDCVHALEGPVVTSDLARLLARAGYCHTAEPRFFLNFESDLIASPALPWDGADIDEAAQAALRDPAFREKHSHFSFGVHAWYRTPEAWAKFERQLEKYGRNPEHWYCNQNEFAAYRFQFLRSSLSADRRGSTLRLRLRRPRLEEVNEALPLTLQFEGMAPDRIRKVRCGTADFKPSARPGGVARFNLYHDRDQQMPSKIGLVSNLENRTDDSALRCDPDFPGLGARLSFADGRLRLQLRNDSNAPLTRIRLVWRLPLLWKEGVVRTLIQDLKPGTRHEEVLTPSPASDEYKYLAGPAFYAVQVDFARGGEPGRLHASCRVEAPARDPSYPQGGFARLGPIPEAGISESEIQVWLREGAAEKPSHALPNGTVLRWSVEDHSALPPHLDPEIIRTMGGWRCDDPSVFLLQGTVVSERELEARILRSRGAVPTIFLNGSEVKKDTIHLRAGENLLQMVFRSQYRAGTKSAKFNREHAGAFIRLVRPDREERIRDIRIEPRLS